MEGPAGRSAVFGICLSPQTGLQAFAGYIGSGRFAGSLLEGAALSTLWL